MFTCLFACAIAFINFFEGAQVKCYVQNSRSFVMPDTYNFCTFFLFSFLIMELRKSERKMSREERRLLRKRSWIMLLAVPVLILFLTLACYMDSLPFIFRTALVLIPTVACIILFIHYRKQQKDLEWGKVIDFTGLVTNKTR